MALLVVSGGQYCRAAPSPPDHTVGSITGTVVDRHSGRPLDFIQIRVLGMGARMETMVRQGRFRLEAVPVGHHRIQAKFIQYCPQTLDVDVRPNEESQVEFDLELGNKGIIRINGVIPRKRACPDSVRVTFHLLHDEVPVNREFECLLRIENVGRHRVQVPRDLRRFISVLCIYPNGDREFDGYQPSCGEEPAMGPTRPLRPRGSHETILRFPGRSLPGRYGFQLRLSRPTRGWLWGLPPWIQHNCGTFESDTWTVMVQP